MPKLRIMQPSFRISSARSLVASIEMDLGGIAE
jgi:hypothetical protein